MLSLDEARQQLAQAVTPLPPVEVNLEAALHQKIAEPVYADIDLPHWNVSAMDGYAVRFEDLQQNSSLPIAFTVAAGQAPSPLPSRTACRIFTGAALPDQADTVVPQEQAEILSEGRVRLQVQPKGNHVRHSGEVLRCGDLIASLGDVLTPSRIALLAASGVSRVRVIPHPRVALIMTGSELVGSDRQPEVGQVRDSNGPLLKALIKQAEFRFTRHLFCADDLKQTGQKLEEAAQEADLIITSGGVSVGDWDFVPQAIKQVGSELLFHKVAIKPGKPVLAARLGKTWILGLPGNPVSVLVTWRLFALPLGKALSGFTEGLEEKPRMAETTEPISNRDDRCVLQPAIVSVPGSAARIQPLPWKGSHDLAAAAQATGLLRLDVGAQYQSGDQVPFYSLTA